MEAFEGIWTQHNACDDQFLHQLFYIIQLNIWCMSHLHINQLLHTVW